MFVPSSLLCLLLWSLLLGASHSQQHRGPRRYKSDPSIRSAPLEILEMWPNKGRLAAGHIFINENSKRATLKSHTPQIYDSDGELVWDGAHVSSHFAQNFRACDYLGRRRHLCFHEHHQLGPSSAGAGFQKVLDDSYTPVVNFTGTGDLAPQPPNGHEFNMLPGGDSFMQVVKVAKKMDLRPYCGRKNGWVGDVCFQEVSTRNGEVVFSWCYLDHYPIWHTHLWPKSAVEGCTQTNTSVRKVGKGTKDDGFDFFHINSADKNDEGDYLISGRHLDAVFKIAGPHSRSGLKPGTTIWVLGGMNGTLNDFVHGFNFSKQHDARFGFTTATEEVISLFDNAWQGSRGSTPSAEYSSSKIIKVNNATMTAELVIEIPSRDGSLSYAQGSTQVLRNDNIFTGWGAKPLITEHTSDGTLLFSAMMWQNESNKDTLYSYRAYRYPWTGRPKTKPKLLAYSKECSTSPERSPMHAYVSWNGATEVREWRFFTSPRHGTDAKWEHANTVSREGFETSAQLYSYERIAPRMVKVEALDLEGKVLGSAIVDTFVPNEEAMENHRCGRDACMEPDGFDHESKFNGIELCPEQHPLGTETDGDRGGNQHKGHAQSGKPQSKKPQREKPKKVNGHTAIEQAGKMQARIGWANYLSLAIAFAAAEFLGERAGRFVVWMAERDDYTPRTKLRRMLRR